MIAATHPICFIDIQISSVKVNIPCKKTNKQTEIRLQQSNIKHINIVLLLNKAKQSKTKIKSDKIKYIDTK